MAVVRGATCSKFSSLCLVVQVFVILQQIATNRTISLSLSVIGSKVTPPAVVPDATIVSSFRGNQVLEPTATARYSNTDHPYQKPQHYVLRISMVEGHSVHRVATMHRKRLVGKCFKAWSPNGRFTEGAEAINGKLFTKIEAVGKNLFAFFGGSGDNCNGSVSGSGSGGCGRNTTGRSSIITATDDNDEHNNNDSDSDVVVVHVHFGMAGAWAVYDTPNSNSNSNTDDNDEIIVPEPTKTNRLRLESVTQHRVGGGGGGLIADLSAMTVNYGGMELYTSKRSKLGEDPLRTDANPESLWNRVSKSKKSIGALIMDQSYFTGPGNIYRAEILFKAGLHPNRSGNTLSRTEFDTVWYHTVDLLRRGYQTGSILTVDSDEAKALGKPRMRRYIYNTSNCPRCSTPIQSWQIASRTCYACPKCQPMKVIPPTTNYSNTENEVAASLVTPERTSSDSSGGASITTSSKNVIPFNSHCARESVSSRLAETGPTRLTVKELKEQLTVRGIPFPKNANKPTLVTIFVTSTTQTTPVNEDDNDDGNYTKKTSSSTTTTTPKTRSKKPYKGKILEFDKNDTSMESSSTVLVSAEHAAMEKASAGENLAVEHIAELAPAQARKARAKATDTAGGATRETVDTAAIDTNDEDDRMRIAQRYTVKELKQELKNRNVTFLSKAKKATLIDLLILSSSAAAAAAAAAASLAVPSTTKKSSELVIDDEKERSNVVATAAEKPITTKRMKKKREGLCHPDHQQGSKRSKME